MKINFILANAKISGGIRMVFQYANYLSEKGHKVICYYPKIGCHTGRLRMFASIYQLFLINNQNEGNWFERKFELRNPITINDNTVEDGDITIATLWGTCKWVQKLSKTKGKKVYFIQGFETWYNSYRNKQVLETYHMNWEIVISVSNALRKKILNRTGLDSVVVCNGIPSEEIRTERRIYRDKSLIVIGFPYRKEKHKNCKLAIEVLEELSKEYSNILVVSYGFKKPEDWPEQFKFLVSPSREQLYDFYDYIDIFYIPSLYEGWGLPAMEAMAHGDVVLAVDSGAISEFGIDGKNCILLKDPENKESTKRQLVNLMSNSLQREQIGTEAWLTIKDNYSFEEQAAKFEKVLLGENF